MLNNKEDIARYFHNHVIAPYTDFIRFRNSPEIGVGRDLQAALNAAEAIYHFREQLGDAFKPEEKDVIAKCPDYALIKDITNFKKHGNHDRNSRLRRDNTIEERLVIATYQDTEGEYHNSVKELELHLLDGTTRDFSEVLTNGLNFWCGYLAALGITPKFPELAMPNTVKPLSRAECRSIADIKIIRGLKFGPEYFRLQRYNYSTGQVEPMNLTGYTPILRVFDENTDQ